ncbi:unnamed protein product [Commensalibacter communis]|nr:unnamed protein product [Commensalibacter communis]CAI3953298.1 unnamed protein product [Commensalibacter communis]
MIRLISVFTEIESFKIYLSIKILIYKVLCFSIDIYIDKFSQQDIKHIPEILYATIY